MAELAQLAAPVVRSRAGFHANQTRRQCGEESRDFLATQLTLQHHLAGRIGTVHLKDPLADVEPERRDINHSVLPSAGRV
jgi:hypothetical protein